MKARDVVGKKIVRIRNERVDDPEYYGPKTICTALYLEDGTAIIVRACESSDQPIAYMSASIFDRT